ncbi:MAG: hypothetical protein RL026_50 [Pseudomonadota bacterium]|jgi:cholesterol transport system auxiliary component
MIRLLVPALLVLALPACGSLQSRAIPERTYLWEEAAVAAPAAPVPRMTDVSLRLSAVSAEPALRSPRLWLVQPQGRLRAVEGARWSGEAPQLLHTVLARGLRDSGRFGQVQAEGPPRGVTHEVSVHLRQHAAFYAGAAPADEAPLARITIDVAVGAPREGRQLAAFALQAEVRARSAREPDVAAALGQAAVQLSRTLPGAVQEAVRTSTGRSTP